MMLPMHDGTKYNHTTSSTPHTPGKLTT